MTVFESPVYLRAAGWVGGLAREVQVSGGESLGALKALVELEGDGSARSVSGMTLEDMLLPLPAAVLKASGVARARSAAKCTVFASVLARSLRPYASANPEADKDAVGLGVVCTSAITPIFWRFEAVGLTEGWDNTDTMLLPASIPSAVVTAASTATDFHATAMTFGDGAVGVFNAIEHAYVGMRNERFSSFMLLTSDEACTHTLDALKALGVDRDVVDGASGLVLCSKPGSADDWRVGFVSINGDVDAEQVPVGWEGAHKSVVRTEDHFTSYTSNFVAPLLVGALCAAGDSSQVILKLRLGARSVCQVGLTRVH